jgi:ATP-dependent Clp protease ATP-binding subunit ClpB
MIRTEIDSMPTELDEVTRRIMQLEIEEAALKKEKEGKLFEFLTPEQQQQYKTLVEQKMKDMKKPSNQ